MEYRPYQKKGTKLEPSFEKGGKIRRVRTSPESVSRTPGFESFLLKSLDTSLDPYGFLKPRRQSKELESGRHPFNNRPRAVSWTEESTNNMHHTIFKSHRRQASSPSFHNISCLRMRSGTTFNPFLSDDTLRSHAICVNDSNLVAQENVGVSEQNLVPLPPTPNASLETIPSAPPPCLPRSENRDEAGEYVPSRVLLPDI